MNNLIKLFMYFFYYSTIYNNIIIDGNETYFVVRDRFLKYIYKECDMKTKDEFFVEFFKENGYFYVLYENEKFN